MYLYLGFVFLDRNTRAVLLDIFVISLSGILQTESEQMSLCLTSCYELFILPW